MATRLHFYLLPLLLAAVSALQPPSSKEVGYAFEYGVRDERSGTLYAHTEFRHGVVTTGQYTVHLPDGRIQTVKYTADHNGYRATVSYEGLAHHPDKIIDKPSKPTNYPPAVAGRPVPVVGSTVLDRPSTIPQATSVSQTHQRFFGNNQDIFTSDKTRLSAPGSSERSPQPISIQRTPTGEDLSPNSGSTSTFRGNLQKGNQYSGAPISPHLINSNILASFERDSNSYSSPLQNEDNASSLEQTSVSPGRFPSISGQSYGHSSFSVPLSQHQSSSLEEGRFGSSSFPRRKNPHVSNSGSPFSHNNVHSVPSKAEGISVIPLVPENVSFSPHSQNIPVPGIPGSIPVVPHISSNVVPTVPFTQNQNSQNSLLSSSQNSQQISPFSSVRKPSQNQGQNESPRNTFRVPHKLQIGEEGFPQSLDFNKQNSFSSSNTRNFNEFYSLPSVPQTRPRKFPPNTFIPSAIDPHSSSATSIATGHSSISLQGNKFSSGGNQLKQEIPPHLQSYGEPDIHRFAAGGFSRQPPNSFSSGDPQFQYGNPSASSRPQPFEPNSIPSTANDFENANKFDLPSSQGGQSISGFDNQEPHNENSVFVADNINSYISSQNQSDGRQHSQSSRPTPEPIIVPNQHSFLLPSPEVKYSSGLGSPFTSGLKSQNVIFRPINEIDPIIFKKPFKIDPDASVFHNEPSIIVDYSHRGSSHEDDSNTVSLTAPYVFVGGSYSPNPASKFAVNFRPEINPNSVAVHGIAPPDPAETGNIRLSPGFLPPHLAKLQGHREEIRTAPTPEPVQLKLAPRRNLEVIGVERKNLPLRNQPKTFGEGTTHTFTPNSVSKTLKGSKQRRNVLNANENEKSEQKFIASGEVLTGAEESSRANLTLSSKESGKISDKAEIRTG